jgi:hypothetical protein
LLYNRVTRAANATGLICHLPIKNEFQAGVIATVHLKSLSFISDPSNDSARAGTGSSLFE